LIDPKNLAVVIPAGGGGTRLWPRSRRDAPKQYLDIVTPGRTMLQETADRVSPSLIPPENLFVITNRAHVPLAVEQLPATPVQNIVGEPIGRDSAPAIGLMAALIQKRMGRHTVIIVLPADHVILRPDEFHNALESAVEAAEDGYLVTIGIRPTSPATGFGYIEQGELARSINPPVYDVKRFREKPDLKTAKEYVASGSFYWNAGMFVATAGVFCDLFEEHLPEMEPIFKELIKSIGTDSQESIFNELFPTLQKISIDYGIIEKAESVAVVPVEMGWDDAGSWTRLADVLSAQADENGSVTTAGELRAVDATRILSHAPGKLVAVIGLENIVVIDTPGALLIADRSRSEDVKKIVDQLQAEGRKDLL